jgi:hypothetical protein
MKQAEMEDIPIKGQEISMPIFKAYRIALFLLPGVLLLFGIPYLAVWFGPLAHKITGIFQTIFRYGRIGVLVPYLTKGTIALLIGIFMHELLHGIGWVPFARKGFRSLQFGFMTTEMSPYAHCKEPLPVYGYRIGIVLPGLILGFLPAIKGIITGSFSWLIYGIFFTWAASGDFIMLWMIRKLKSKTMVMDHPGKLGCIIL